MVGILYFETGMEPTERNPRRQSLFSGKNGKIISQQQQQQQQHPSFSLPSFPSLNSTNFTFRVLKINTGKKILEKKRKKSSFNDKLDDDDDGKLCF